MKQRILKIAGWCMIVVIFLLVTVESYYPSRTLPKESIDNQSTIDRSRAIQFKSLRIEDEISPEDLESVKQYASEFGIDFRLILAIIKQESQFDINAESERGVFGLMQLMPVTHAEVAEKLDLQQTHLPKENIKSGIYYFTKLCELFQSKSMDDRIRLALAAYNAGPSRIYDAQELAAYMGENPNSWSAIENVLPLLSKRYYTLHQSVWEDGRPRSGYFGSWKQTINYVESIMKTYQTYKNPSE